MKVEKPDFYWTAQNSAVWGFYWSYESKELLITNRIEFLTKYVKVCIKYGVCIPLDYLAGKTVDEVVTLCLQKYNSKNDWYILHNLYVKHGYKTPLFPCMMYPRKSNAVASDFYIDVSLHANFSNDDKRLSFEQSINHLCKMWSFKNIDESKYSILFYLETDAFFKELSNHSLSENIDNSELAYLNTPRLNSFVRDITTLLFEFGAQAIAFDNLCEAPEEKTSRHFKDHFLLVDGELVFYEEIYSLLPDACKYQNFERIQVMIDDSNYKNHLSQI